MDIIIWNGKARYNIGDKVEYEQSFGGERRIARIVEVSSDMDSYEDMKLRDGVPYYASKKMTAKENKDRRKKGLAPLESPIYAPVREKNIDSVFLGVENSRKKVEFIFLKDIVGRMT